MIETTTRRRLSWWRRKCRLQHRGRDGAVPAYIFLDYPRRGTEYQNGAAKSLWTTATTHRFWCVIKFWAWLMPQAWKIKNAPKSCLPKFGYVCPPNFCCTMYTGPIQRALKKKHPRARSCMACSRGQRSNRLQIESGRGSEEGGRHSSL